MGLDTVAEVHVSVVATGASATTGVAVAAVATKCIFVFCWD